jgi:hypothetical protein
VVENYAVVKARVPKSTWYRATQAEPNNLAADILGCQSFRRENLGMHPRPDIHWQQVP